MLVQKSQDPSLTGKYSDGAFNAQELSELCLDTTDEDWSEINEPRQVVRIGTEIVICAESQTPGIGCGASQP